MYRFGVLLVFAVCLTSCGEDDVISNGNGLPDDCYDDGCATRTLPFSDSADAPALTDVTLECQSHAIVLLATATDPQGGDNLRNILQTIGVYPDVDCQGAVFTVQDDFVDSGVEESFGDVVTASTNQALYDQICACSSWPVEAQLIDADQNMTSGRVVATVTH